MLWIGVVVPDVYGRLHKIVRTALIRPVLIVEVPMVIPEGLSGNSSVEKVEKKVQVQVSRRRCDKCHNPFL